MDKSDKKTIVEQGTTFKGTLASSCPIDVRGRIEGEVETPSLTVSKSGAVHGRAKVGSVRSQGELSGEFDAESIELAGRVLDNTIIRARSFEVKLASERGKMQVTFGQCELAIGDEPTEHVALEVPVAAPVEALVSAPPAPSAPIEEQAVSMPLPPPYVPEPENPILPPPLAIVEAAPAEAMPPPEAVGAPPEAVGAPPEAVGAPPEPVAAGTLDELLAGLDAAPLPAADEARSEGRKKRKQQKEEKNGEGERGWSAPPSQPPPAS